MSWAKLRKAKSQGGMDFRNLICFNKSLLAKQCWRLVQNPDSLAATIIKGKYFSRGEFMKANLESKPSFAWRSILVGRELLEVGMVWRIGDGKSVAIWLDRWIPRPTTFSVMSPCKTLPPTARVEELITGNPPEWNRGLIHSIFLEDKAEVILSIPLSKYNQPDRRIWQASSSGEFTVQSGYHFEVKRKEQLKGGGSSGPHHMSLWKKLWGLKVPNATKVFLWRACNNILPTKDNLKKKGVVSDDLCSICGQGREIANHVIWECIAAQDVWTCCDRSLQKRSNQECDFAWLVEEMVEKLSDEELGIFAIISKGMEAEKQLYSWRLVFSPKIDHEFCKESFLPVQFGTREETRAGEFFRGRGCSEMVPSPSWLL